MPFHLKIAHAHHVSFGYPSVNPVKIRPSRGYVQVMLEYNYNHLDRDKYMSDSNFNCIQGRLMFSF